MGPPRKRQKNVILSKTELRQLKTLDFFHANQIQYTPFIKSLEIMKRSVGNDIALHDHCKLISDVFSANSIWLIYHSYELLLDVLITFLSYYCDNIDVIKQLLGAYTLYSASRNRLYRCKTLEKINEKLPNINWLEKVYSFYISYCSFSVV